MAIEAGAEGSGLVRTEFLFLGRESAPTVAEQEVAYRAVAERLDGRRAVFRTLDIGGDQSPPHVEVPAEANPFLGLRGIRLALARPDLLRDQLLAIWRVAADHPVSVMIPMVSDVGEVLAGGRSTSLAGAVRLSLGAYNDTGDIDRAVEAIELDPPARMGFRHLTGPVPHAVEQFRLDEQAGGMTELSYDGELGIDFATVLEELEKEGVEKFSKSYHDLLDTIEEKQKQVQPA